MGEHRRRWIAIFIGLTLLLNAAAVGGIAVLAASPSAADWIAPKLHLATHGAVADSQATADDAASAADEAVSAADDAQSRLDDIEPRVDEAESTLSSLCEEFNFYSGAFQDIYLAIC